MFCRNRFYLLLNILIRYYDSSYHIKKTPGFTLVFVFWNNIVIRQSAIVWLDKSFLIALHWFTLSDSLCICQMQLADIVLCSVTCANSSLKPTTVILQSRLSRNFSHNHNKCEIFLQRTRSHYTLVVLGTLEAPPVYIGSQRYHSMSLRTDDRSPSSIHCSCNEGSGFTHRKIIPNGPLLALR